MNIYVFQRDIPWPKIDNVFKHKETKIGVNIRSIYVVFLSVILMYADFRCTYVYLRNFFGWNTEIFYVAQT